VSIPKRVADCRDRKDTHGGRKRAGQKTGQSVSRCETATNGDEITRYKITVFVLLGIKADIDMLRDNSIFLSRHQKPGGVSFIISLACVSVGKLQLHFSFFFSLSRLITRKHSILVCCLRPLVLLS
jgi:hypothetical protein